VVQVAVCLSRKHIALSLNPNTTKKKKSKKEKQNDAICRKIEGTDDHDVK
jgi:hypothetical protein